MSNFELFRQAVLSDESLQERLLEIQDRPSFVTAVVELGAAGGYNFTVADVEDELRASRHSWIERWS